MASSEADSLAIPAGEIQSGDMFHNKGQRFTVWGINSLEPHLIEIYGEVRNYRASLIVDDRLLFQAVIRPVAD